MVITNVSAYYYSHVPVITKLFRDKNKILLIDSARLHITFHFFHGLQSPRYMRSARSSKHKERGQVKKEKTQRSHPASHHIHPYPSFGCCRRSDQQPVPLQDSNWYWGPKQGEFNGHVRCRKLWQNKICRDQQCESYLGATLHWDSFSSQVFMCNHKRHWYNLMV